MASTILVAGLINIETTLRLEDGFPMQYVPVRYPFFGVKTTVSGVGYNIAKALTKLDDTVRFVSLVGEDEAGTLVQYTLKRDGILTDYVRPDLKETAQSVIAFDHDGKRAIFTDLKDIQETAYSPEVFSEALADVDMTVLANINFSRPFLQMAKARGIPIATDVHAIGDLHDEYNADYMRHADILFMSHENLPVHPHVWLERLRTEYGQKIMVVGMGADGALLALPDGTVEHIPAVQTRPIVNTIGAGDSLFSAFVSEFAASDNAIESLRRAVVFASWKIGANGGAAGFLTRAQLDDLYRF